jgi:flagellar hook-associated protein 2
VADADATGTAAKLGIAASGPATSINSGDLHLQVVASNTLLSSLNGGNGVARGSFTIVDTTGQRAAVNLKSDSIQTVGDLIQAVNRLPLQVHAELNATGDGIVLEDTAHGPGTLQVIEGGSTTAADLHLAQPAATVDLGGVATQVIDGSTTYTIALGDTDSLTSLRDKINALGVGVQATILNDGSTRPYRLSLNGQIPGRAGNMVWDTGSLGFSLDETVRGQDALMAVGNAAIPSANLLMSSSSNQFRDALPGATLTIKQTATHPVTVTVATSNTNLVANVKTLVDNYNKFRSQLDTATTYNTTTNKAAVLTGDTTTLRLESEMASLVSGRFTGAGSIQSLAEVGIGLKDDGTLELDQTKLEEKYASNPDAVQQFFTTGNAGVSARFHTVLEQLTGQDSSLLTARTNALSDKITQNNTRLAAMDARLTKQRDAMTLKFYNLENVIAKMQSSLSMISAIEPLTWTGSSSSSNSSSST